MADLITFKTHEHRFHCGTDYTNLHVVVFKGPFNSKLCAYCCNMQVDLDADPQAYGPYNNDDIKPREWIGNAGWLSGSKNDALKALYDTDKQRLDALKAQLAALAAGAQAASPLKGQIEALQGAMNEKYKDRKYAGAPHHGEIFWDWYGISSMTKGDADNTAVFVEKVGDKTVSRGPKLDRRDHLMDVWGRYPIVQSGQEPGPGYYVNRMPQHRNPAYRDWDERSWFPPDTSQLGIFAVTNATLNSLFGIAIGDYAMAIRPDLATGLVLPFFDSGPPSGLGEVSADTFVALGGQLGPPKPTTGAWTFKGGSQILFLAFPDGRTPRETLNDFALADNKEAFIEVLSFIAELTIKAGHGSVGNPLASMGRWLKDHETSPDLPTYYSNIHLALHEQGYP